MFAILSAFLQVIDYQQVEYGILKKKTGTCKPRHFHKFTTGIYCKCLHDIQGRGDPGELSHKES